MARQARYRASFDFETYGWNPEGEAKEAEVNPLCCGFKEPLEEGGKEHWLHDKTRQSPQALAEEALRFMSEFDCEWWAHYSHGFDTLHLVAAARRMKWRIEATIGGQGIVAASFTPPKAQSAVEVRDLYRVLQSPLKSIGKDFDLPSRKLFKKTDYKGDMRLLPVQRLREGCLVDCRLVLEALSKVGTMLEDFGGHLRTTFSSSAMTVVQHSLKERRIKLPQHREDRNPAYCEANKRARISYAGARVEVFHHHPKSLLNEWDINSSYPWSMSQSMPTEWLGEVKKKLAQQAYEENTAGIYRAIVEVPPMWLPPLPYKPKGGGLYFPIGKWSASFALPELKYAESLGCKVRPYAADLYEEASIFADFVAPIYELKRTAHEGAVRLFGKLLLNGCYGKWAEKPEREKLIVERSELEAWMYAIKNEGVRVLDEDIDPCILTQEYERYARHAHYAIGSYITAHSRILWHRRATEMKGLAYGDTDSFHAESWKGEPGTQLGQLKLELSNFRGRYYAPKLYSLHNPYGCYLHDKSGKPRVACKGFPKGTVKDFESILRSANVYRNERVKGKSKQLAKVFARNAGVTTVRTRLLKSQIRAEDEGMRVIRLKSTKSWSGLSKKRRPKKDGSTVPWSVKELDNKKHVDAESPMEDSE